MIASATSLYKQKFRPAELDLPHTGSPVEGDLGESPTGRTPRATSLASATRSSSPSPTRPSVGLRSNESSTRDYQSSRDKFRLAEAEAWSAQQTQSTEQQLEQMKREMRKQQKQLQEQIEHNEARDSKISIIDAKLDDILRVLNTWPVSLRLIDKCMVVVTL